MNTSLERGTKVKPLILNPRMGNNNELQQYRKKLFRKHEER